MIIVVLGAGASKDSNRGLGSRGNDGIRMPLANELFDSRPDFDQQLMNVPHVRPIVQRLRDSVRPGGGIEAELEALKAESATDPGRGVQLNAVLFYLQAIITEAQNRWVAFTSGVSNYGELLDRLRNLYAHTREPVRVVTFNYDTLIDSAFQDALQIHVGLDHGLASYTYRDDFKLYKVHGSTNWVQAVENEVEVRTGMGGRSRTIIELGSDLRPDPDGFSMMQAGDPTFFSSQGLAVPAMAVPLASKADFVMPPLHIRSLNVDLASVRCVLVIGWRGADQRLLEVWNRLKNDAALPDLLVVSGTGESAQQTAETLGATGVFGRAEAYMGSGFSDFLADANQPLERFLARGRSV